jgi:hypothetical protein
VSADFVHSRYCYEIEMRRALERHGHVAKAGVETLLQHAIIEGQRPTPAVKRTLLNDWLAVRVVA